MKQFYKNIKKIAGLAALSVLIAAGLVSCDFSGLTDTIDEFGVVVELDPINTNSTVLLYDAVSGELITNNVTITYSGDNGDDVIDAYSDPISSSTVSDGILGFGINNAVTPSESSPASIRLIAEANGYITKSKTIHLTQTGQNEFEVEMVRENNKPEGVETATSTEGQADETGSVQQDFSLESTADDASSGSSVDVTTGTVFQDASGNALTGQLTSSMTYYNPSEEGAMSNLPVEVTDEEGNPVPILGGAAIEIRDANGRKASSAAATGAKASQAGHLTYNFYLDIDRRIRDFISQQDFSNGMDVDVIYFEGELNPTYTTGTMNYLTADGQETDDFFEAERVRVRYTSDVIPSFATIWASEIFLDIQYNFTINRNGNNGKLVLQVTGYGTHQVHTIRAATGRSEYILFSLEDIHYSVRNATQVLFRGGAGGIRTANVTVDLPEPPENLIDSQVDVALSCSNGGKISTTDLPNTSVLYRIVGAETGTKWATATDINFQTNTEGTALQGGTFNVTDVEQGADYDFKVNFDGDTYNQVIEITGTTTSATYTIDNNDVCTTS